MKNFTRIFSTVLLAGLFSSASAQQNEYTDGVFMLNEGSFGKERATINFLDKDGDWHYRLPITMNGETRKLGTTGCFATISEGKMYIVSKKNLYTPSDDDPTLVVCDAKTLDGIAEINTIKASDGTTADGRAFLPVPELNKGYLSTTNGIYAVSLQNNSVLYLIEGTDGLTNNQAGNMIYRDGKLYALDLQRGLLVINTTSANDDEHDKLEKAINNEGDGGTYCSIVEAKDGSIWLTAGTTAGATADHLVKFDPTTETTENVALPEGTYQPTNNWSAWNPDCFTASTTENALFWNGATGAWSNGQHIYKYDIDSNTTTLLLDFTKADAPLPYAYGAACRMNPDNGYLYLSVTMGSAWGDESELRVYDPSDASLKNSYPMEKNYWFPEMPVFALKSTTDAIANTEASDAHEVARFTVDGKLIQTPQKGLNIVKYSDGSVKKVIVK